MNVSTTMNARSSSILHKLRVNTNSNNIVSKAIHNIKHTEHSKYTLFASAFSFNTYNSYNGNWMKIQNIHTRSTTRWINMSSNNESVEGAEKTDEEKEAITAAREARK